MGQRIQPARQGTLDLSGYSRQATYSVPLNGQWYFRWQAFVNEADLRRTPTFLSVPGSWAGYAPRQSGLPVYLGHATYGLQLRLPEAGQTWSLRIPPIRTAYRLYLNGKLLAQSGRPATGSSTVPQGGTQVVTFSVPERETFLVLQVANYHYPSGGQWTGIRFGHPDIIHREGRQHDLLSMSLLGALALLGIYHLGLYLRRRHGPASLYLGIISLLAAARELFGQDTLFYFLFPTVSWETTLRFLYLLYPIGLQALVFYSRSMLQVRFPRWFMVLVFGTNAGSLLLVLLTPPLVFTNYLLLAQPLAVVQIGYLAWALLRAVRQGRQGTVLMMAGMIVLAGCVGYDLLVAHEIIQSVFLLPVGVGVFAFCQSWALTSRLAHSIHRAEAPLPQRETTQVQVAPQTESRWDEEAITLPTPDERPSGPMPSLTTAAEPASPDSPLVLLVAEREEVRAFITEVLSQQYRMITAANGQEGWERCRTELPDLVISEVAIPQMDGYALCRQIRQTPETDHVAIMLLMARAALENRLTGLESGANEYLTRPFHPEELRLRVQNLIRYPQRIRQQFTHLLPRGQAPVASGEDPGNPLLRQIQQVLEQQAAETGFSVEVLAAQVAMSSRTLNRRLGTLLGTSANELIRRHRLQKAAELLQTDASVADVAFRVGFDNPSYFSRCFKEMYQVSPSDFARNRYRTTSASDDPLFF